MRLICPSCGAQYDVPEGAIPPAGRDVQCSACGHTWFERPPGAEAAAEPEPWDRVPRVEGDEEEADDLADAQAVPPPPAAPAAPRSTVTPEVAGILQAEAAREAQARAEASAPKAVPGADRPAPPPEPPPAPEPPEEEAPALPADPPRSALRPAKPPERRLDLDQINSSLRTANDRIAGKPPQIGTPRRRSGFASGFWGALLVLAVLAGLYVAAPRITAAVPEAGVVLDPYVTAVNEARLWLDRQVGAALGGDAAVE